MAENDLVISSYILTLYLIETPLNAFASRTDEELPDWGLLCLLMVI